MKPLFTFLCFLYSFPGLLYSQVSNCPPNIDFENGNFSNWQCYIGTVDTMNRQNVTHLTPSSPTVNRHEIMSSTSGNDNYGNFPKLCPYGGGFSVKLGNATTGAQAEGISYSFTVPVTPNNDFSLTYYYAVVFQDPGHPAIEQPRFKVKCSEVSTGNLINCASYDFIAAGAIPGFQTSPLASDVRYKGWTPVSIDFGGMAGSAVILEFTTADCTRQGHFGYGYVDVGASCSNALSTGSLCAGSNQLILNAPFGFQSYTWWNDNYTQIVGNTQTVTITPAPPVNTIFHVDLIPFPGYGCRDTANASVTIIPLPDTPIAPSPLTYCQFQSVPSLTGTASPGNYLQWYTVATGGTASLNGIVPSTNLAGTRYYYVSQKNQQGCEGPRREITVNTNPTPTANFTVNNSRQCQNNNQFIFTGTSTDTLAGLVSYQWTFGDGLVSTLRSPVHTYTAMGNYTVQLTTQNPPGCFSNKTLAVVVVPKPNAQFSYPDTICNNQTQVVLLDNSSTPGNLSTVNGWYWNINGIVSTAQNPVPFTVPAGTLIIKQVAINAEGCISDTNLVAKQVHSSPSAAFLYSWPLCINDIIRFSDRSVIPGGNTNEVITNWDWQFSNGPVSILQNPQYQYTAGLQDAKLIVTTNFGCYSSLADSFFTIYPKPLINVSVNDSCVNRVIHFTASDISGLVNKWWWDFGSGLYPATSVISKTFTGDGYKPFKVIGQTIFGCKDTILRPFTTFSNRAIAGNDTITAKFEPVQLNASGGVQYLWTPSTGLNNAFINNPIAIYDQDQLYQLKAISKEGCDSYSKVLIRRYKGPELYIPTAFTPNGDNINDLLKVFPVGIKKFGYFAVYNRLGQRVFYTMDYSKGWDGSFKGRGLDGGSYVFIATATDYSGKEMFRKGSVIMIR